jgi:hypothetical protein
MELGCGWGSASAGWLFSAIIASPDYEASVLIVQDGRGGEVLGLLRIV